MLFDINIDIPLLVDPVPLNGHSDSAHTHKLRRQVEQKDVALVGYSNQMVVGTKVRPSARPPRINQPREGALSRL